MDFQPPKEPDAEVALLHRIAQGDRAAFAEFYDRFSDVLFSIAMRILPTREAAEDVLQDVFLQIWEKAPLFDQARGKPLTWAITLARNRSIDRLRLSQRRSRVQQEVQHEVEVAESFDTPGSFDALASAEFAAHVRAAMQKLSQDQRVAIELTYFRSMTHSEIAAHLGEPLNTIKARVRRGLLRLRELLGKFQ